MRKTMKMNIRKAWFLFASLSLVLGACTKTQNAALLKSEEDQILMQSSFYPGTLNTQAVQRYGRALTSTNTTVANSSPTLFSTSSDDGYIAPPTGSGPGSDNGFIPGPNTSTSTTSSSVASQSSSSSVVSGNSSSVASSNSSSVASIDPVVTNPSVSQSSSSQSSVASNSPGGGTDDGYIPGTTPNQPGTDGGNIPTNSSSSSSTSVTQNPPSSGSSSSSPSDPTNPSNPSNPSNPTNPTDPSTPVVQNPPVTNPPGTPSNPSTPTNPGNDDGNIPNNPPATPGTDGGNIPPVVTNPPTNPTNPSNLTDPSSPSTPTNPSNPTTPPVVQNPPVTNPPGTPSNPSTPTNPGTDGGNIPNNPPGTPGTDGGNIPPVVTNPPANPTNPTHPTIPVIQTSVNINRVCSVMRSKIPYPMFVFFEEAARPILTFEALVDTKKKACISMDYYQPNRNKVYTASMSAGFESNMQSMEARLMLLVIKKTDLANVDLFKGPYKTPISFDTQAVKSLFPNNWKSIALNASICDDSTRDGSCADEPDNRMLSIYDNLVTLGQMPKLFNLYVWSGRNHTLAGDPEICDQQYSPLVLDTAGDGFQFSPADKGVVFDLNDTGSSVLTGWTVGKDDAFLVRDIDRNGTIDSGAELFGSATRLKNGSRAANGFLALAELDSNQDGMVSSEDADWSELRLWFDLNHDGYSQASELKTLDEVRVDSIRLDYLDLMEIDPYGNQTRQRSTFRTTVKGVSTPRMIIDVWFHTLRID